MITLKSILAILLFFIASFVFSQTNNDYSSVISGSWITTESLLTTEIESPMISPYFKYEFVPDSTVYFGSNQFERGKKYKYDLRGDTIKMFGYSYAIQHYREGRLELKTKLKWVNDPYTFVLVRKEKYDSIWKFRHPITPRYTALKPVFKGRFHFHDYLFSESLTPAEFERNPFNVSYGTRPPRNDVFIKVKMAVDSTGNITVPDVIAIPEIGKKQIEKIKHKIENTSGLWMPASRGGKNVNDTLNLTFVKRGETSLKMKSKALDFFKKGYTSFQKEDYAMAIQYFTNAINLDAGKFQFYLLRAVCNLKLKEIDKYCDDVVRAYSLHPFIQLENIEIVEGEALQIKCGGK